MYTYTNRVKAVRKLATVLLCFVFCTALFGCGYNYETGGESHLVRLEATHLPSRLPAKRRAWKRPMHKARASTHRAGGPKTAM